MQELNQCGCCEGISKETPLEIYNRPGLSAISYRVGSHPQFKESLLNSLTSARRRALTQLTSRDQDDFTIALLDAWASVSDVLTFYQERIANESYLRTATEQFSILEMARLIGYELRPGVAAGTFLAFTIDANSIISGQLAMAGQAQSKVEIPAVTIDVGTKVQSIPEKDEVPQSFETIEPIEARAEWNVIKPKKNQILQNIATSNLLVVAGTGNNLKAGDVILVAGKHLKKILKVELQQEAKTSWLYLSPDASFPSYTEKKTFVPNGQLDQFQKKAILNREVVQEIMQKTWTAKDLSILLESKGWSAFDLAEGVTSERERRKRAANEILVFRQKATAFGYNAAKQVTYSSSGSPTLPSAWPDWTLQETKGILYLDAMYEQVMPGSKIIVQTAKETLTQASIYTVDAANTRSRTDYGLSAKSTQLVLSPVRAWWNGSAIIGKATGKTDGQIFTDTSTTIEQALATLAKAATGPNNLGIAEQNMIGKGTFVKIKELEVRTISILVQSEALLLMDHPIEDSIRGRIISLADLYLGLKKGQKIILSGEREDLPGAYASEVRGLEEVYIEGGLSILVLDKELTYPYRRNSVTINANVAAATHGETVGEILGNGDAGQVFQKFILKQPPLTFVSAATPSGTASSLEVRVNDILWKEVPSLYDRGPEEHIYITRQDDQARTTITFGDGLTGARLPSGQQNVKATYRKGIGTGGLLKANQLSQLVTRPLGVKAATNPTKTSGAQDREILADARRNASLTVFTLGRIVSLQDYGDFSRAFAGIAKSLAVWTWSGRQRRVFITVAGYNGAKVEQDSSLYENLVNAILAAGIPDVPVTVASYEATFFRLTANVKVQPDYLRDKVFAGIETALRKHFSFANREFGQGVPLSEVYTLIQNVEGVVALDIDHLYLSTDTTKPLENRLIAFAPRPGIGEIRAAELLTLDPGPIQLNEIS